MALFGKKENKEVKKPEVADAPSAEMKMTGPLKRGTLIMPRITEKGAYMAEAGVYVFNVMKSANKHEIARAVKEAFGVMPRMVRVAPIMRKQRQTRGTNRKGKTVGGKKAYVYLKKGDKIEIS